MLWRKSSSGVHCWLPEAGFWAGGCWPGNIIGIGIMPGIWGKAWPLEACCCIIIMDMYWWY